MIIDPGQLDRQITTRREVKTGEGDFGDIFEWVDHLTVWAMKQAVSADEVWASNEVYAKRTVTFITHWFSDIKETDRIVSEGVTYDIKGLSEIGTRDGLEIKAEASNP